MNDISVETRDAQAELLSKLRDLLPSAFPDGDLDVRKLLEALEVDREDRASFSCSWPGIEKRVLRKGAYDGHAVPGPGSIGELGHSA